MKRLDVAVFSTIEELVRGTLETSRTWHFSLSNGGVGLGRISPDVPPSLIVELEEAKAAVVAGGLTPRP